MLNITLADLETICSACSGSGVVYNSDWDNWTPDKPEPELPEEIGCGECDGVGSILTESGCAIMQMVWKRAR